MRKERLYLLRVWSDGEKQDAWRASLENLRTKELVKFKNLDELQVFLNEHMTSGSTTDCP
jgi:hypothetical protein